MKTTIVTVALAAALAAGAAAQAQVPSGGPGTAAKANAAAKPTHTVNDGIARRGSNSFTEGQARGHIERAGYSDVTGLAKGRDGVWRGRATKGGAPVEVGMDYKGNVSEGGAMAAALRRTEGAPAAASGPAAAAGGGEAASATRTATVRHKRVHHRRGAAASRCAAASAEGAACSGVDRNRNGVSDKEDRGARTGVAR